MGHETFKRSNFQLWLLATEVAFAIDLCNGAFRSDRSQDRQFKREHYTRIQPFRRRILDENGADVIDIQTWSEESAQWPNQIKTLNEMGDLKLCLSLKMVQ